MQVLPGQKRFVLPPEKEDGILSCVIGNGWAEPSGSALGTIYAGGGQQRIPVGQNSTKITVPDSDKYKVGGTATITGTNAVPNVDGAGTAAAIQGHPYIQTPVPGSAAFQLLPYPT